MAKLFNCRRRKAAAEKATATFTFTVDEAGYVQLNVTGNHSNDPNADIESKMYHECCKLQMRMLNWQSRRVAGSMGDGEES